MCRRCVDFRLRCARCHILQARRKELPAEINSRKFHVTFSGKYTIGEISNVTSVKILKVSFTVYVLDNFRLQDDGLF